MDESVLERLTRENAEPEMTGSRPQPDPVVSEKPELTSHSASETIEPGSE
jgi:hypothetical protein